METIEIVSKIQVNESSNQIAQIVEKFDAIVAKKWNKVIFQVAVDMDPTEHSVRYHESALPNWICDICCEDYSMNDGFQEADLCMLFGFYFAGKSAIHEGDLTLGQMGSFFKTNFLVVVVELTGAEIVQVFRPFRSPLPLRLYLCRLYLLDVNFSLVSPIMPLVRGTNELL